MADLRRLQDIFGLVVNLPASDRPEALARLCGDDRDLRVELESLLRADDDSASVGSPAAFSETQEAPDTLAVAIGENQGDVIGRYKLLQRIGEGGFGVVFMAEQRDPVVRKVALKIIKLGMDTRQVIARFEAERQALALMDHPNIAKVLDAGATESGRPYFVMDLVQGDPITAYCDREHLTIRERLELFAQVCHAVQHAHQKGLIHRDIKPSNVLVSTQDGRPHAKVIDFGIAKATAAKLTEKTLFTEHRHFIGTPQYMSPEQAAGGPDVDTRTDVYSLGVLLYELLTGVTPFDARKLRSAAYAELQRIIREVEPPKPSTRLSGFAGAGKPARSATKKRRAAANEVLPEPADEAGLTDDQASLASIAALRRTDPGKLAPLLRGDLDWIVMKALEKDRARRYETANGLAMDLHRHLAGEPVVAAPPRAGYRLRKFVRRNRTGVIAAGLVAAALVLGLAGTTSGVFWALRERDEARAQGARAETNAKTAARERDHAEEERMVAQAVRDFLQTKLLLQVETRRQADALLAAGEPTSEAVYNPTIRELLDRAAAEVAPGKIEAQFPGQMLVQADLLDTIGNAYLGVGYCQSAIAHLQRARDMLIEHAGPHNALTLTTLDNLARAYVCAGRLPEAISQYEHVRDERFARLGPDHSDSLDTLSGLAWAQLTASNVQEAIRLFERLRESNLKQNGPDHQATLINLSGLALAYRSAGKLKDALAIFEPLRERMVAKLGPEHPDTLMMLHNLADTYSMAGRRAEAIQLLQKLRDVQCRKLGPGDAQSVATVNCLGRACADAGRLTEAIALHQEAFEKSLARLGPDHPSTLAMQVNLASDYRKAGLLSQAKDLLVRVLERRLTLNPKDRRTLATKHQLGQVYQAEGNLTEALQLFEQVRDEQVAALGPDDRDTFNTLLSLGSVYEVTGKLPEAISVFEKVSGKRVAVLGMDHPDTLISLMNLGAAYVTAGRVPEALRIYEQVRDIYSQVLSPDDPTMLTLLHHLATAYKGAGRLPESIELYEQVIQKRTERLGADHVDTLSAQYDLAVAYFDAVGPARALPLFKQVLEARTLKLGAAHPDTLRALAELAVAYRETGRLATAVPMLEQAVAGAQQFTELAASLRDLLDETYYRGGEFEKGEALCREILDDVRKRLRPEDPQVTSAMSRLTMHMLNLHKYTEAEPLIRECLAIRQKTAPEDVRTFNTLAVLGGSLLGQGKYAEAEPLLLAGYEGMKQRQAMIPPHGKARITEALERLAQLYDAWHAVEPDKGYDAKAVEWRARLAEYQTSTQPATKRAE